MTVILVGKIASGKSAVADILTNEYGYERMISYTTREKREDEIDGVDYHFISEDEFVQKIEDDFFLEYSVEELERLDKKIYYGTAKADYEDIVTNKVVSLDAKGATTVRQYEIRYQNFFTTIIYLYAPDKILIERAITRGDNISDISTRASMEYSYISEFETNRIYNYSFDVSVQSPELIATAINRIVQESEDVPND